ncbi:tRNA pseudouridine(38-40) synthase TruA [Eubacterium sp. AM46-8]|uniref:tRNA pseudouridine(38-40) synthase TruA n=1 Tax=Eubacterium sp. AM46-8 TaxID=2292350 RepID=UPI000E4B3DFD|nr:tRNA pseudouridine(38-40) synthase TruA [Eubacterium sp. AM46-8]RGZ68964.1 tRNA pseudouridine(38-40) synthase TruA [Eubacterium sp. AM49-13BH]RGZ89281.1 tRNA pseudouridine(38-40) synthase TruA [Eubacterium sp. AM46-8]
MRRIKLIVAYDGTEYSGWQIQPEAPTIEMCLDKAIHELTGENVHVTGASRTDAGVHAYGNVAVFDTESTIPGDRFTFALNRFLPDSIVIQDSWEVSVDFHPRHCNTRKTYEYRILNTAVPLPQKRNFTWHVAGSIDIEKMKEAAAYIVGEHDFKSFCCVRTQAESTVRTIYSLEVLQEGSEIIIRIKGNGFLYNMVRIITGTLIQVGKGRFMPEYVKQMLEAKDRTVAGQTAPPQGLTLVGIEYVDNDDARVV